MSAYDTDHIDHNLDGEQKEVGDHPDSEMRTDVLLSVGSKTYLDSEKDN